MEKIAEELMSGLEVQTVFTIPVFGGIDVSESVVVTWIIMAFMLLLFFVATRGLKTRKISKAQAAVEVAYDFLQGLVSGIIGEKGKRYVPYLVTIMIYIGIANIIGLVGFKPPTKDLNVTAALSLMSIVLIEYAGIHAKGMKKWVKSFAEPVGLLTPFNILELFIRPLSLCMRLFGNVLGAFVVMELLKMTTKVLVPAVFSLYFDFFDGFIQAYIFVFLTSLYIKEAID